MSRTIEEQISALLDGELEQAEEDLLLRRLERDDEHRATFVRYGMIGDCLRGEATNPAVLDLGDRVRDAVEKETPSMAPKIGLRGAGLGKGLLGAGIAAAVAVIAVTSLTGVNEAPQATSSSASQARLVQEPAVFEYTVPVDEPRSAAIAPARLTSYMVSHAEYANSLSRQALDARIVNQLSYNEAVAAAREETADE